MDRRIETIPSEEMEALTRYHWPGNVRELENLIERAVILSRGPALHISLPQERLSGDAPGTSPVTLVAAEREHILSALSETNWVIAGSSGAATRLGMKRTTLQSRMAKLGISRPGRLTTSPTR
jgi:formate hydrogenlyase transcriptional activator